VKKTVLITAFVLGATRAAAQGSIAGTVFDSLTSHAPLANATLVLVERNKYTSTDARGRFRFDSVPDGHYTIGLTHPVLDAIDLVLPLVPVDVANGRRTSIDLSTPPMVAAYARICPGPRDPDSGVIIGTVRDADDRSPLSGADVGTQWTDITLNGTRVNKHRAGNAVTTNRDGVYLLCNVPTGVPLDVFAEHHGFIVGPLALMLDDRLIRRVDLAVSTRDSAARDVSVLDSTQLPSASRGTASLRGTVLSSDGRPVRSVIVEIRRAHRSARTDSSGHFRVDGIPAGSRTVEIRALGFAPATHAVSFAAGVVLDTALSIGVSAQDLASVTVAAPAVIPTPRGLEGFELRRKQGHGHFISPTDMESRRASSLADVLAGIEGVHVNFDHGGFPLPYLRGTKAGQCIPNFFLDGAPFAVDGANPSRTVAHPFTDLTAVAHPDIIRAIEVYTTSGTMPAEFDVTSSTGCGSVLIWTH
jgi:hypothetical protein